MSHSNEPGPENTDDPHQRGEYEPMRLNKYIAHCGITSRRKAAELVKSGKIKVNDSIEDNPAYLVKEEDQVFYRGKLLQLEEEFVYLLMNKPKNTITSKDDQFDRRTVMDLIRDKPDARIYPVGRLDWDTTGLLLLTNDGDLAKKLTHPSHEVEKVYEVELERKFEKSDLDKLRSGLELEDGMARVDSANYVSKKPANWVSVRLHIGRNRIVRRMFEHLGYEVQKLDRVIFAGLNKKGLSRGRVRPLTEEEVRRLKYFT